MARSALIVGAGQCGLLLAHGLLNAGWRVTLACDRTPDQIRCGRPTSTQVMFGPALNIEHAHGLDLWATTTPPIHGLHLTVAPPGGPRLDVVGVLDTPARSTDQRLKMPTWLRMFELRGGHIRYNRVGPADLDAASSEGTYDLTIVAAGHGPLANMFVVDEQRSPFTAPQRALAVAYVHGMRPDKAHHEPAVAFTSIPGAGELLLIPTLTRSGPCDILFWEAIPGGPLDVFGDRPGPTEHLHRAVALIAEYAPWHLERCSDLTVTGPLATLVGGFTPTVRHATCVLPSGGLVLGAADTIISNDPITAQGANTAARCAQHYLSAILEHGNRSFDLDWMTAVADQFWVQTARAATTWTETMLRPPGPHMRQLLDAAARHPPTAALLAQGFTDPNLIAALFTDPAAADRYLASIPTPAPASPTRPAETASTP